MRAPDRFGHHHRTCGVDAVNLEQILRDIEPVVVTADKLLIDFLLDGFPQIGLTTHLGRSMPVRAPSHPITIPPVTIVTTQPENVKRERKPRTRLCPRILD